MLLNFRFIASVLLVASLLGCSPTSVENTLPTVAITAPNPLSMFETGDVVRIEAVASDPDGRVTSVSFYVGDRRLGTDTTEPFSWDWDTSGEPLQRPTLRAVAADDGGGLSGDEVEVLVDWVFQAPEAVSGGWPVALPEEVGLRTEPLVDLVNILRRDAEHRIHGIVVIRHGKLAFEKYFDGFSHPTLGEEPISYGPATRHLLSSVTKSFTTALLGVAIQKGFISGVDAKVMPFFPEHSDLAQGEKNDITLEHLATMSSGLEWDEWTLPLTDSLNSLTAFNREAQESRDAIRWFLEKPMVATPGTEFTYSGGNSNVLGEIIGRAGGMRLDEFAGTHLFEPLGIDDYWYLVFPSGLVYASGDLGLRPRDAARFGQLYLNDGVWDGVRILPEGWMERAADPYHAFSPSFIGNGMVGYSYGWWVKNTSYGQGAFDAWGWGGQDIMVIPEYDMVVVLTAGGYWEETVMSSHTMMTDYILPAVNPGSF
jgi:CubicO group peptidase (beta-lactamase class C family)